MKKYCISFFDNCTDVIASREELSFEEILNYFTKSLNKPFIGKEKLEAMVGGSFKDNRRSAENLISRSILTFDLDGYEEDFDSLKNEIENSLGNYSYIYYTTSSSTLIKPRARILLFIDKDVDKDSYGNLGRKIAAKLFSHKLLRSISDESSFTPSQLMYLPNKVNNEFRRGKNVKELIKVDDYIIIKEEIKKEDEEARELIIWSNNLPLPNVTRETVIETLGKYDCKETDYKEWFTVCQALHHQFEGSDEGLEIFTNWSLTDTRYTREHIIVVCRDKYKSVNGNKLKPVTFASVIKIVNYKKKTPSTLKVDITYNELSIFGQDDEESFIHIKYKRTKNGELTPVGIKSTFENFEVMCRRYKVVVAYDVITKRIISSINNSDDNVLTGLMVSLMELNNMNKGNVPLYLHMLSEKNKINSFREVINNVIWDGKSRLDDFYNTLEVEENYKKLRNIYLLKWTQQMLYLALNDDEVKDIGRYLLVLKGSQNIGKTTWVLNLLPSYLRNSHIGAGRFLDTNNDMNILGNIKFLITELAELEQSFKKTDINGFKAFFGRPDDTLNIKYLARPVTFKRTTSFIASINDDSFLKDITGSTRFMVIPVKKINRLENIDILQVYKELLETTDISNFQLTDEETSLQETLNKEFEMPDIIEEAFIDNFDVEVDPEYADYYSAVQILEQLGYRKTDINYNRRVAIGRVLNKYKCYQNSKTRKWKLKLKEKN